MTEARLAKTRVLDGTWHGRLTLAQEFAAPPAVEARYGDTVLEGLEIAHTEEAGRFNVSLRLPAHMMTEGWHTILFVNLETGETMTSFSVLVGDALAEDMRAEVELLRAELDMLKKAFRRHCVETM